MSEPKISKNRISRKTASFTESVIREMTREAMKYGAVNLGQGFPDFAAPDDIKQKAMEAIAADHNQYAITWGVKDFRDAIAKKTMWFLGLDVDLAGVEVGQRGAACVAFLEQRFDVGGNGHGRDPKHELGRDSGFIG